jgi:tagaturonate epimerase
MEKNSLGKYSLGVGDRFAHQAEAQLEACLLAAKQGVEVIPVWNKSNREHNIIGSEPASVRSAADSAVRKLGWTKPYHVDADHINFETVDRFLEASDFYTIDVADWIGKPASAAQIEAFAARHPEFDRDFIAATAAKYLAAVTEAGRIYRKIEAAKGRDKFIPEVSMDETDSPQTPAELLVILAAIADEKIPIQTIAPKFTGRFNKGVDYVGDVAQFEKEFSDDLAVIAHAVIRYGLPSTLKLSVHSGSDKFSIYASIRRALARSGAGVHVKTAGTTWLEELIGLAESGGKGLAMAKDIYGTALIHREELCAPYATVIDVDPKLLPSASEVNGWTAERFVESLRHDRACTRYNSSFRQLLHVAYKVAAKLGNQYLDMLEQCEETISPNVTTNLYDRHLRPVFVD